MFKVSEGTVRIAGRLVKTARRLCVVTGVVAMTVASRGSTFTNLQTIWTFAATNLTAAPSAAVTEASDGMLYGTTYGGSTASDYGGVYKIGKDGNHFQVMHRFFQTDGENPSAPLIEATNGVLYGTTTADYTNNGGTIFQINKDGSGFAVLHYFTFATNDGGNPFSGLLQASDGRLYGTAQYGGTGDNGVVFRMDLTGSNFMVLHSFTNLDGTVPEDSLIQGTNGLLYGTTYAGGSNQNGTVFQIDTNGNNFAVIHYFAGGTNDGYEPYANLFKGPNGKLYGTTLKGGTYDGEATIGGIAFSMDYSGSNYTILHNFGGLVGGVLDGSRAYSGLIQGPDGALYGTTYTGGGFTGFGTVFGMNNDGSSYAMVVKFNGTNGGNPNPLIAGSDGALYGTCNSAETPGQGTVFKLTGVVPDVLASPINLGNGWRVSGHGWANLNYTLLYTTNISTPSSNWTALGTVSADNSGNWQYDDLTNTPLRFYETSFP